MGQTHKTITFTALTSIASYTINSLEDEIQADRYCSQLLKFFHRWLVEEMEHEPLEAGRLAAGADYFLREFLIGAKRQNIYHARPEHLKQFGGNWYIISNLEPNLPELKPMLSGAARFYEYCAQRGLCKRGVATEMDKLAQSDDYFAKRIDDFFQLQDNGYSAWDQACSFK